MAPLKRKSEYFADDFVVDDDQDTTSATQSSKRNKATPVSMPFKKDEEGKIYWEISKARRVTVSDFKGKQLVSIREYYEKDGKWLPGKKGISMTLDQYNAFIEIIPNIEEVLQRDGSSKVARPNYEGPSRKNADDEDDDTEESTSRANHEATSDEGD